MVCQDKNKKTTPDIETLHQKYGLESNCTPEQAFAAFKREFSGWVCKLARTIADMKGVEFDDVCQDFYMTSWQAANDEAFSLEKGKSIIGWMHQRVTWRYLTALRSRSADLVLSQLQLENEETPEDRLMQTAQEGNWIMNGSQSLAGWARRLEAAHLIEAAILAIQTLPEKYKAPIAELLDPSPSFVLYCYSTSEERAYRGAYAYEICSSKDLFAYTGSNRYNLEVAIRFVLKKVPEIKEFLEGCRER